MKMPHLKWTRVSQQSSSSGLQPLLAGCPEPGCCQEDVKEKRPECHGACRTSCWNCVVEWMTAAMFRGSVPGCVMPRRRGCPCLPGRRVCSMNPSVRGLSILTLQNFPPRWKKKSPIFQMNILYSGLLKQCLKVSNFLCIKAIVLDKENYRTQNGILYTPFLSILKEIKKVWLIFKNITVGSVLTTWVLVALNHDTM